MKITITNTRQGLELSAMRDGYRVHKLYIGYTRKEAIALFKEFLKEQTL